MTGLIPECRGASSGCEGGPHGSEGLAEVPPLRGRDDALVDDELAVGYRRGDEDDLIGETGRHDQALLRGAVERRHREVPLVVGLARGCVHPRPRIDIVALGSLTRQSERGERDVLDAAEASDDRIAVDLEGGCCANGEGDLALYRPRSTDIYISLKQSSEPGRDLSLSL